VNEEFFLILLASVLISGSFSSLGLLPGVGYEWNSVSKISVAWRAELAFATQGCGTAEESKEHGAGWWRSGARVIFPTG
jgi:hypothetical protein